MATYRNATYMTTEPCDLEHCIMRPVYSADVHNARDVEIVGYYDPRRAMWEYAVEKILEERADVWERLAKL